MAGGMSVYGKARAYSPTDIHISLQHWIAYCTIGMFMTVPLSPCELSYHSFITRLANLRDEVPRRDTTAICPAVCPTEIYIADEQGRC